MLVNIHDKYCAGGKGFLCNAVVHYWTALLFGLDTDESWWISDYFEMLP